MCRWFCCASPLFAITGTFWFRPNTWGLPAYASAKGGLSPQATTDRPAGAENRNLDLKIGFWLIPLFFCRLECVNHPVTRACPKSVA